MTIEVETKQRIACPLEDVFAAWVDPEQMSGYFITSGSGPLEAGETVVWRWADHGGVELEIEVGEVAPPHGLTFTWSASGVQSEVCVELRAESPDITEVTVRDGSWPDDADGIARYGQQMQGWVNMLTCLKAYLEYERINLRDIPEPGGLEVEQTMKAEAAAIYDAWTRGWERWFATPGSVEMRPEVGAPFRFEVALDDGRVYPHFGRFLRLEPDRLIEHTWLTEATRGVETQVTVELTPQATGTHLRLTHTGFRDAAARRRHEPGWRQALVDLDRCLTGPARA